MCACACISGFMSAIGLLISYFPDNMELFSVYTHVISPCMNSAAFWYIDKPTVKRTLYSFILPLTVFNHSGYYFKRHKDQKSIQYFEIYASNLKKSLWSWAATVDLCWCQKGFSFLFAVFTFFWGKQRHGKTVKNTRTLWTNSPLRCQHLVFEALV